MEYVDPGLKRGYAYSAAALEHRFANHHDIDFVSTWFVQNQPESDKTLKRMYQSGKITRIWTEDYEDKLPCKVKQYMQCTMSDYPHLTESQKGEIWNTLFSCEFESQLAKDFLPPDGILYLSFRNADGGRASQSNTYGTKQLGRFVISGTNCGKSTHKDFIEDHFIVANIDLGGSKEPGNYLSAHVKSSTVDTEAANYKGAHKSRNMMWMSGVMDGNEKSSVNLLYQNSQHARKTPYYIWINCTGPEYFGLDLTNSTHLTAWNTFCERCLIFTLDKENRPDIDYEHTTPIEEIRLDDGTIIQLKIF